MISTIPISFRDWILSQSSVSPIDGYDNNMSNYSCSDDVIGNNNYTLGEVMTNYVLQISDENNVVQVVNSNNALLSWYRQLYNICDLLGLKFTRTCYL